MYCQNSSFFVALMYSIRSLPQPFSKWHALANSQYVQADCCGVRA